MRTRLAIPALLALLILVFLASLAFGELRLSFGQVAGAFMGGTDDIAETYDDEDAANLAVGAALGASGAVMQAFFRNPLASPGLLGVSSGGALGAVAVLALGPLLSTGLGAGLGFAPPRAEAGGAELLAHRTLDGRQLYAWCRTAGFVYEAHLRAELTERLGVRWGPVRNGIADVAGISKRAIDHFSQRRRQITDRNWAPKGIAMQADAGFGETPGGLQAPT